MAIHSRLAERIALLEQEFSNIPEPRRQQLGKLTYYISSSEKQQTRLNFICTHNSRRSHLGMIWAAVAAAHYGITGVHTFSGGTEATAFNPRAVAALKRAGFVIEEGTGKNPHYQVYFSKEIPPLKCFSKVYDHPENPQHDFAAIMTCSDADENCPLILGAEFRLPLTYEDPKVADDTPQEAQRYDERVAQIGRELLYAFSLVREGDK